MSSTPTQPGEEFNGTSLIANRYRIKQRLGKGTFGEVFLADDLKFNPPRAVAIKMLHNKFLDEPEVRADIEREASVLARFNHANILRVIDFDISENQAFIVTELAEGGSLASKIRPDPLRPPVRMALEEVGWYLEQLTDALDEAHQAGLIHRDLKPLNILLNKRGRPLIADFGLATAVSSSQSSVLVDTQTSGTPPYMAPEQWMGHAGRASDIYALGIITYQLITGELPYQGGHFELMGQHLNAPIPRLYERAPGLVYPPALDNVIAGVLAKDPRQRTHSALEFYRHYRNAIMPFPSPSSSIENFPYQPGAAGPGLVAFQGQPGQQTPPSSNPPAPGTNIGPVPVGSTPPGSNPPGGISTPPQRPQTGPYNQGLISGPVPPGSHPGQIQLGQIQPDQVARFNSNFSNADATRQADNGSTAAALPANYTPDATPPGTGQLGVNRPGIAQPGPRRTGTKNNTGLVVGLAAALVVIVIAAIIGGILLSGGNSQNSAPSQPAAIEASPTDSPSATTATATATATETLEATTDPATETPTVESTTAVPTTASLSISGHSVVARQGSLRKVVVSDSFARAAIQGVASSASSGSTLQVFSSSETPDKVKTELDNGLAQEGYNYAVPEPHKAPPSDFYGGYTRDGSPDLVYIILASNSMPAVLKNSGVDDATIAKLMSDTKGQQSVIFSFEGDGFVYSAFAPDPATPTLPVTTAATGIAGPGLFKVLILQL